MIQEIEATDVIKAALLLHAKVFIKYIKDQNVVGWVVCLKSEPAIYFDIFEKKKEAKKYVKEHGLILVKE
jgi:hypothetical protein